MSSRRTFNIGLYDCKTDILPEFIPIWILNKYLLEHTITVNVRRRLATYQ